MRNLLILGYISSLCPTPSLGSLCDSTPYSVPFDRISVHLNQELGALPETHLFAALNCALVALCSVQWDSDQIKGKRHILEDETMPGYIIDNEVMLRCFGFGMIRAIDIEERLFYVLTPVDRQLLNEVNVFSKGANIDIPNAFLSQQKARDAPYVVRCNKNGLTDGLLLAVTGRHIRYFVGHGTVFCKYCYHRMSRSPENVPSTERRNMQWRVEEVRRNDNLSFSAIPMIPREYVRGVGENGMVTEGSVWRNALNNPLVPLGMLATVGCLIGMCRATLKRNMYRAQLYMRGRVAAQFFTVCVLAGGALAYGNFNPNIFESRKKTVPGQSDAELVSTHQPESA
ncbi:unnamed protein product [Anisakis simplex]|uniref:HIG1 domain-containing protein n=1 Tax=Anisakis simplex TaxID=6269 RepID=A0A3P6SS39_ANISI|nr:unnamed protein product [Anisakis simplex]